MQQVLNGCGAQTNVCDKLLRKTRLHVVYHRHLVVTAQHNGGESSLLDRMNAGICSPTETCFELKCERDVQQHLFYRETNGHALETERVRRSNQPHTGHLDIYANGIGQQIDGIAKLTQPLHHLPNGYWSTPILVEGLGCND
jgi:hypothetical protein